MLARLFAYCQYLLPKFWLTAIIYRLARISNTTVKDFLITRFVRIYKVDVGEIRQEYPGGFATFNDFFIRELAHDARPIDDDDTAIVSPVDGTISQIGDLHDDRILQAKGIEYSLNELLATDLDDARVFANGRFATIYLAPYNYHRVHAPLSGELVAASYIPGDLFSVNTATASHIRGLFRRNERLVLKFRTAVGPAAVILVGAMNVGSISTPWSGELRPRHKGMVASIDLGPETVAVARGELLGWFNLGSTVIVLLPGEGCGWREDVVAGRAVQMGQRLGSLSRD